MSELGSMQCPREGADWAGVARVQMAHGGGGRAMHELIRSVFREAFASPILDRGHDSALLPEAGGRLAFSTDAHVVRPLFFPGGDIGSMSVHGTVNDLAMSGARPRWLSAAFVLEEGLPMETLRRVVVSMGEAARECGVEIVTGDTKVVEVGKADGMYIVTSGVGEIGRGHVGVIEPASVRPGDAILVSGDIGRHGMAVLAVREGLEFESALESDSGPVWKGVEALLSGGIDVHCLRDLTRGGLGGALVEIAESCGLRFRIEEEKVPVRPDVGALCELLGLDPLQVACEGRFAAWVPEGEADRAVELLRNAAGNTAGACRIGRVESDAGPGRGVGGALGRVIVTGALGADRVFHMPVGEQLPRIC